MNIKQASEQSGVSAPNIRFYEKEGLLTPARRQGNDYRDYTAGDVRTLKLIRMLRMLDVPIEEILRLKAGSLTLTDAMGRHMIQLERRQANLEAMHALCAELRDSRGTLDGLDADGVLERIRRQEQEGARFVDVKKRDHRGKYLGAVWGALVMLVMMGGLMALILWGFTVSPEEAPPLALIVVLAAIPVVVILGVLMALYQRIKQIRGGEEDDAAQY